MELKDCLEEIALIESDLSNEINTRLSGFTEKEKIVASRIIDDTVDLIQDLSRDTYMFNLSLDNYNNTISFMPQYYFENLALHYDMIWERLIIIIAIAYGTDFEDIFVKKNIGPLFKRIKKNQNINPEIINKLFKIKSDNQTASLKESRNNNEHLLSSHLMDAKIEKKFEKRKIDAIYIVSDKIFADLDEVNEITEDMNYEMIELFKPEIKGMPDKQKRYINLLKLCIIEMEKAYKSDKIFSFKQMKYFLPKFEDVWVKEGQTEECHHLEDAFAGLREKYRLVVDRKNETIFTELQAGEKTRSTLLIDSLFRAKEMIRSINCYLGCMNYYMTKKICATFSDEEFHKYYCNDLITSNYYYDHAVLKLYSVYEKVGKFLLCKYDFDDEYLKEGKFDNMYVEKILKVFETRPYSSEILEKFKECVTSDIYKEYEDLRNREYHRLRSRYFDQDGSFECINICVMKKTLTSLYELFEMIVDEERTILEAMIEKRN